MSHYLVISMSKSFDDGLLLPTGITIPSWLHYLPNQLQKIQVLTVSKLERVSYWWCGVEPHCRTKERKWGKHKVLNHYIIFVNSKLKFSEVSIVSILLCQLIYLSVWLNLFISVDVSLSIHTYVHLTLSSSLSLSVCLCLCLSLYPFIYSSNYNMNEYVNLATVVEGDPKAPFCRGGRYSIP